MTTERSAWRYTGERAVAFFSVLCLNWHEGSVCTRPAGHKGKHRHSLKVAWEVVPDLLEARRLASDYATALNDEERARDRVEARLVEATALINRLIHHFNPEAVEAAIDFLKAAAVTGAEGVT